MAWFMLMAFAAGIIIAMQPPINAELTRQLGHPMSGALWNFCGGMLVLIVAHVVFRIVPTVGVAVKHAPWWAWLGGVLGAIFVTTSIFLLPRIGVAAFTIGMLSGQIVSAMLIDQFGLLGADRRPATPGRLFGAALVVVGVAIVGLSTRAENRSPTDDSDGPLSND